MHRGGSSRRRTGSRLFGGEPLRRSLGGKAVGQLAELDLRGAEEGGRVGIPEGAGDLEQRLLGGQGDGGAFVGLSGLVSGAR